MKKLATIFLVLLAVTSLSGLGKKENSSPLNVGQELTIQGVIKVVGNEPFANLVLVSGEKQYNLRGNMSKELRESQLKTVRVTGILLSAEGPMPAQLDVTYYELVE